MEFVESIPKPLKEQNLIVPVLSDPKKHWSQNRVSFIYCYGLKTFQEQILTFNHIDCLNLQISVLSNFLGTGNYIHQKKYLSDCGGNFDAQMAFWLETNQPLKVDYNQTIRFYHSSMTGVENLNDFIPIMKWLEWCREIKDVWVSKVQSYEITETLQQYDLLLENLSIVEKNGLFVNL